MSYRGLQKSKGRASETTVDVFKKIISHGALHAVEKIQKTCFLK